MNEQQATDFINQWCKKHPLFPDLHRPGWVRPVGEKSPTMEDCLKDLYRWALELERGRTGCPDGGRLR